MSCPGGKPVTAVPGATPKSPLITEGPVLVTWLPAKMAKGFAVPNGTDGGAALAGVRTESRPPRSTKRKPSSATSAMTVLLRVGAGASITTLCWARTGAIGAASPVRTSVQSTTPGRQVVLVLTFACPTDYLPSSAFGSRHSVVEPRRWHSKNDSGA